ncbi:hypothetical protein [Labrys okinawensis]|uniref:hypothetical protein n=1 Tax=Labrys okinawensis TaxID=346911 RepID=UPI0015E466CC|nr:hypothetical protein [Labrys okinawensis]
MAGTVAPASAAAISAAPTTPLLEAIRPSQMSFLCFYADVRRCIHASTSMQPDIAGDYDTGAEKTSNVGSMTGRSLLLQNQLYDRRGVLGRYTVDENIVCLPAKFAFLPPCGNGQYSLSFNILVPFPLL